jgi:Na+/H+ antiporter NhaD/arsenite permease-like protein
MHSVSKKSIFKFLKQEFVLVIATLLAIISCFFVPVSKAYLDYIDFRVLSLLFCLMLIVAGFRSVGFFYVLSEKLFHFAHTIRSSALVFILLCFFSSMLITNDVALILFVPLSIFSLKHLLTKKQLILLIVFETIAANLGSMFTPIGNPQNLYIFSTYQMNIVSFFKTMFPYTAISFLLLLVSTLLFPKTAITDKMITHTGKDLKKYAFQYLFLSLLFFLTITTVVRITPFEITLTACSFVLFFVNRKLFLQVDYCLLGTFIALFIFVGNMGQISFIQDTINRVVVNNEVLTSILLSQIISNVPATLLLSHFTQNSTALLVGVNLGGLGTLIASMASLISYKFYVKEKESSGFLYFLIFTLFNILFLGVLFFLPKAPGI